MSNWPSPTRSLSVQKAKGAPLRETQSSELEAAQQALGDTLPPAILVKALAKWQEKHHRRVTRGEDGCLGGQQKSDKWQMAALEYVLQEFQLNHIPSLLSVLDKLQKRATKLYREEYNHRAGLYQRAGKSYELLKGVSSNRIEPSTSPHYPGDSLLNFQRLKPEDKRFSLQLLRSTRIEVFHLPDFEDLIHHRRAENEYNFELHFSFGYNYADLCGILREAFDLRKKMFPAFQNLPRDCSNLIAEMLGNTRFEVQLKVYFDKTKIDDWHEQDGEAWIYHPIGSTKHIKDLVNFDKHERIYYVENWPRTGLLAGDYSHLQTHEMSPDQLERTLVTWVCSQVTWLTFEELRSTCSSRSVRNSLSKLLFVLKGWYTGLLLGESFDPEDGKRIVEPDSPDIVP